MTNIFKKLTLGSSGASKKDLINIPYTNKFYEINFIGNKRTGSQIEEWTSKKAIEISKRFDNWDGKSTLNVEIPNNGKGEMDLFHDLLENDNLPKKISDLGYFNLFKSSSVTDFISGSFLSQYGLIISKNVKLIVEKFNLGKHQFYPIQLEHKGNFYPDYFLLKSIAKIDEFIDISRSFFYYQKLENDSSERTPIKFNNQQEIDKFLEINKEKKIEERNFVYRDVIVLNKDFPNYDLFYSKKFNNESDSRLPIISERLKNALEGTTGIDFHETDRIKCCY